MIAITAKCILKPEAIDEFLTVASGLVKESRNEAGNISYELFRSTENPAVFTFIECWKDKEAIDFHNSTPHFLGFVDAAGPLFAGPLEIAHWNPAE